MVLCYIATVLYSKIRRGFAIHCRTLRYLTIHQNKSHHGTIPYITPQIIHHKTSHDCTIHHNTSRNTMIQENATLQYVTTLPYNALQYLTKHHTMIQKNTTIYHTILQWTTIHHNATILYNTPQEGNHGEVEASTTGTTPTNTMTTTTTTLRTVTPLLAKAPLLLRSSECIL